MLRLRERRGGLSWREVPIGPSTSLKEVGLVLPPGAAGTEGASASPLQGWEQEGITCLALILMPHTRPDAHA